MHQAAVDRIAKLKDSETSESVLGCLLVIGLVGIGLVGGFFLFRFGTPETPPSPPSPPLLPSTSESPFPSPLTSSSESPADLDSVELKLFTSASNFERAREKSNKGDNEGAIKDYTRAIKINEDWGIYDLPTAYNNRGVAYFVTGDRGKASEDYTKAIDLKSDFALAYYNRGLAWAHAHNASSGTIFRDWYKQQAIADLQKAADLFKQQGHTANYQEALNEIEKLEN